MDGGQKEAFAGMRQTEPPGHVWYQLVEHFCAAVVAEPVVVVVLLLLLMAKVSIYSI